MTRIEDNLADIADALRHGDFEKISTLSARLETISFPLDPSTLRQVARLARDNARMLAATVRGLRAAQRRIAALRAAGTLTTYDNAGHKRHHAAMTASPHRI